MRPSLRLPLLLTLGCSLFFSSLSLGKESAPQLKIGLIKSLLAASNSTIGMAAPLGAMLGSQMGCQLQFVECADHADMAQKLRKGEIHLGVIHGVELCWLKAEAPEVEPIALAMAQDIKLRAKILVRVDEKAEHIREMKGKKLLRANKALNHNLLYLTKVVSEVCPECDKFFGGVEVVGSVDATLDSLVDGNGDAMVIDAVSWEVYKERKPGRAKKLRVLSESCCFPTAAVVCKPGVMNDHIYTSVKAGFLSIHEKPIGQQMLVFWRLSKFVPVTEEYHNLCRDILKEYPNPMQPAAFAAKK